MDEFFIHPAEYVLTELSFPHWHYPRSVPSDRHIAVLDRESLCVHDVALPAMPARPTLLHCALARVATEMLGSGAVRQPSLLLMHISRFLLDVCRLGGECEPTVNGS